SLSCIVAWNNSAYNFRNSRDNFLSIYSWKLRTPAFQYVTITGCCQRTSLFLWRDCETCAWDDLAVHRFLGVARSTSECSHWCKRIDLRVSMFSFFERTVAKRYTPSC